MHYRNYRGSALAALSMLTLALILTGCGGRKELTVRAKDPEPPVCLVIPDSLLKEDKLPNWLLSPAPTSIPSPRQRCKVPSGNGS